MPDLKLDPTLLSGATVQKVGVMRAEVTRKANHYLLLQCTDSLGNPFRLMLPCATVSRPCPSDKLMLEDLSSGTKFFTLEEIITRRNDRPLASESLATSESLTEESSYAGRDASDASDDEPESTCDQQGSQE